MIEITCSRAIRNHVFAIMDKRFAWFVCVVFTAKNISFNWMVVGFGVTVPASITIPSFGKFDVTSFNVSSRFGFKFPLIPSKSFVSGWELCWTFKIWKFKLKWKRGLIF